MPHSIIAGIPLPLIRQSKKFLPTVPGWSIQVVPAAKRADLSTCWNQVLAHANGSSDDGTHILAYHKPEKERPYYESTVYSRHRLIWLDHATLGLYGTSYFTTAINKILQFEAEWRETLRPRGVSSPLMLPESSFDPMRHVRDLWQRSHQVRIGRDKLESVHRLTDSFRAAHRRPMCWVDVKERIFDYTGERHALHVDSARLWKFTFRVPDGFHFDVTCTGSARSLLLRDYNGATRSFRTHANIDCHGYFRD